MIRIKRNMATKKSTERLAKAGGPSGSFRRTIEDAMKREMVQMQREAMINVGGKILQPRSGRLRNSISFNVRSSSDKVRGSVWSGGPGVKYARIHEEGGTITPKTAKWLTVPLDAAKTQAGVTRGDARSFRDTFFLFRKGKKPLIMQKKGKKVVPLFVLLKKVKIKKRPYMKPAIKKRIPYLKRAIKKGLRESMRQ